MIPQLERRLGKLEAKLKPPTLRAIIEAFVDWSAVADSGYVLRPLPPDDARLHQDVDERGDAVISRWWRSRASTWQCSQTMMSSRTTPDSDTQSRGWYEIHSTIIDE